jgi:putative hydrolase of the HAD superfamily
MIRILLFDLDDTLYPEHTGVMEQVRLLMLRYLQERFHLSLEEANALRRHYFQTYGTTLRGLQIHHQIDPEKYLHHVHNIPLHEFLRPNPELDGVLGSLPQQKVIFTNASREHAERVLALLGVRQHFGRIIDVRDLNYESKPEPSAYQRICELLDARPEECLIVEDIIRNLRPAKALGMTTVLVGDCTIVADNDGADYIIPRIEEIGRVLAEIESASSFLEPQSGQGS